MNFYSDLTHVQNFAVLSQIAFSVWVLKKKLQVIEVTEMTENLVIYFPSKQRNGKVHSKIKMNDVRKETIWNKSYPSQSSAQGACPPSPPPSVSPSLCI